MRIPLEPMRLPLAIALAASAFAAAPTATTAQTVSTQAFPLVEVNTSRGRMVTMSAPISDVFVADPMVADVQVRSPTQIYVFGKAPGETTVSATTKSGRVVYAATVRVGNNYSTIPQMLALALPEAKITATTMDGLVLLTGVVAQPDDAAEAERLVKAFVGDKIQVLSRLKTATPLQVNLQVKIAEVSRSFIKNIGVNMRTRDNTSGFQFGLSQGRAPGVIGTPSTNGFPNLDASSLYGLPAGSLQLPFNPKTGTFVIPGTGTTYDFSNLSNTTERTAVGLAGKLLDLDVLSAIDLGETTGQVTTLANPNLTALSGETATFLAGGGIPLVTQSGLGASSVQYKEYGVSLAYTPTVLADGRISLRVRPEVSQLSDAGAVIVDGTKIPAFTTRRTETTVELGSGESLVISGLLSNSHDNAFSKTPGVADLPVIGALFRSNGFKRNETELVVVVTPYLVKPVNANDVVLPTDGYRAPTDLQRVFMGTLASGKTGEDRPKPTMETPTAPPPSIGNVNPVAIVPAAPAPSDARRSAVTAAPAPEQKKTKKPASATPGFSFR